MAAITRQNDFVTGTTIVAAEVDEDFNDLFAQINTNVAHIDGTNAFTAVPTGPATDPTTDNHLARKAYVDAVSGGIMHTEARDTAGVIEALTGTLAANTTNSSSLSSFDVTIPEVIGHYYRATLFIPELCTSISTSAYNVMPAASAIIKRAGTELARGRVEHNLLNIGNSLTLVAQMTTVAASTASREWTVWFRNESVSSAAVKWKAGANWPATWTIEDLGTA